MTGPNAVMPSATCFGSPKTAARASVGFMFWFVFIKLLGVKKRGLRCRRLAASLLCLGLLAGDALTIPRNLGKQIERVRRKTELMLRQRLAALVSFHGRQPFM